MIPDYQTLMLPVLMAANDGAVSVSDVIPRLADKFALTDAERTEMLPSGRITLFANRVHWAKTYLKQAGLIQQPRRSYYELTERGRKALQINPARIDNAYLSQFPEFLAFKTRSRSEVVEVESKRSDFLAFGDRDARRVDAQSSCSGHGRITRGPA
jgi:restriction system protein